MIITITGNLGEGKTLLSTTWGYLFQKDGYTLCSNYKLKPPLKYIDLNTVDDFLKIKSNKNIYMLDEYWVTADARRSSSFKNILATQKILQSRKKKAHVIITAQDWKQTDVRIRNVTDIVMQPEIIQWRDNKPLIMEVNYFMVKGIRRTSNFLLPLHIDGMYICDMYDTYEIIESMDTGIQTEMRKIIDKYIGYTNLNKTQLESLILQQDLNKHPTLNKSNISDAVNYIKLIQVNPELDVL